MHLRRRSKAFVFQLSTVGLMALLSLFAPRTASGQIDPPTAEREFAEAFKLFSDQLYREATQAFVAFRTRHPDHIHAAEALYYQAEAALALGEEDESVRLFTRFERLYPLHPLASQARLALGKYFFEAGQYDRAVNIFEQILADRPPDELAAKALYWIGEAELQQGRFEEAIRYYRRAADNYRNTATAPVALYAIGFTEVRQERPAAAAEAFELLAARYPESRYARNIGLALAEVYYELDDYQRAVDEIQRRLPTLGPEARERASFLLAESFNQLRRSEDAIIEYNRFLEGNPNSPYYRRALYGLAWNYYFEKAHQWAAEHFARVREGQSDELAEKATYYQAVNEKLALEPVRAIELYREFLRRWPRSPLAEHAQFELAVGLYEQRNWAEAYAAFSELIERYPESEHLGEAVYLRGNTAIALNRVDDAEADFERAIALDAAPAELKEEVAFQKAWLQYRTNRFEQASKQFMALYEAAPRSDRGGQALFWAAESEFQLGHLTRAGELFRQYQREVRGGRHIEASHYALGWVYFRQGRYDEAATSFRQFLDAYRDAGSEIPYHTDALLRLADSYYALKRYPEAIRMYREAAEQAGDYALYQTGQAYYNAGQTAEAMNTFRRLLSQYPDSPWAEEAQYTLGYIYFQNQDYDQAIAEYEKLINHKPQDPLAAKAQYGIGDALFNAGRTEEAVAAYTAVLERYPRSAFVGDAATGIQYALSAMGDERRAERLIRDFEERFPGSPVADELRFRQAEVKYQSGKADEALLDLQQFVRSSNNEELLADAYFYMGTIQADRGRMQEAEGYFRQVVDAFPESSRFPQAVRRMGEMFLDAGRAQQAHAVYRRLETMRSDDRRLVAEARAGQGMALLQMGRTAEAEQLLRDAIEAAPDAPETLPAYLGLARVYEGGNKADEAIRLYRRLAEQSRDEVGAEALYRLGALLLRRGDARGAIQELSRVPVLFASYPEWVAQSYLAQAHAFIRLGQPGEAAAVYDKIIADFSGTSYAETALQEKEAL